MTTNEIDRHMHALHEVFLGLGANIGHRESTLLQACEQIRKLIGPIVRQSTFFHSAPWGFESEHEFVNMVVRCQTEATPHEVLHITQLIERRLGRTSKSVDGIYHDRLIDIDILLYDHLHLHDEQLTIPHPFMQDRPFVMIPLHQVLSPEDAYYIHYYKDNTSEPS